MRKYILLVVGMILSATPNAASTGQWNAYMSYSKITDIEPAGNKVYVLASDDLFSYNLNDNSIETYDKVKSLSDSGISYIAWCKAAKKLVVVYSNQNIDLVHNDGTVENNSSFYRKIMTENKKVFCLILNGKYAYLGTDFGIVKFDVQNNEITATYNIGHKVEKIEVINNVIFCKTEIGIRRGDMKDNLLDPAKWTGLISGDNPTFKDDNGITTNTEQGYTELIAYDEKNKCYWSTQKDGKLQSWKLDNNGNRTITVSGILPEGPAYNYFTTMRFYGDKLYSCGGSFTRWGDLYRPGCIQTFDGKEWFNYEDNLEQKTGIKYIDIMDFDIDPTYKDGVRLMAGGRTGMYEFIDGKFVKLYNTDNSLLQSAYTVLKNSFVIVSGLNYDKKGNLWVLNGMTYNTCLLKYGSDKKWERIIKPQLIQESDKNVALHYPSHSFIDSNGLLWFTNDFWQLPSFYCFNPENNALVQYKEEFKNQDGTKYNVNAIESIMESRDGNIWIGSSGGPAYLPKDLIGKQGQVLVQMKVPRNDGSNLADYLLNGVNINCMAEDPAGRKWFGTFSDGVYLIDSDNITELKHFTAENSSLLDNAIESIAINNRTGEVFFGTPKGLCSYMSNASQSNDEMDEDKVYAYPNPVKPDYNGLISVVGLTFNADVKITTSNGVLVNQGRSNGGMYTWDGRDLNGKRVASGIYMVQTATASGEVGTVCKIAIVN
ncbi:type IX secretion system anionic LPS delivery protein PorZ [Prevotella koreensis]